jgi:D-amino-acid dehydrogenase
MLPDGPPVLGASGAPGVWLNLGHGSSGWALACGSARVLADQLAGRSPAIDVEGLDVGRLGAVVENKR